MRSLNTRQRATYDEKLPRQSDVTEWVPLATAVQDEFVSGSTAESLTDWSSYGTTSGSRWVVPAFIGEILVAAAAVGAIILSTLDGTVGANHVAHRHALKHGDSPLAEATPSAQVSSPEADSQYQHQRVIGNDDTANEPPDRQDDLMTSFKPTNDDADEAQSRESHDDHHDRSATDTVPNNADIEGVPVSESRPCDSPDRRQELLLFDHTAGELAYLDPVLANSGRMLGKPIDVLAKVDPRRDAVHGTWRIKDGKLILPIDPKWVRLQLPVSVPSEYRFVVRGTPHLKKTGFNVGLVGEGGQFAVGIDEKWSQSLHLLDGKRENETKNPGELLETGKPAVIFCQVLSGRVTIVINGLRVIDWQGDQRRLSLKHEFRMPNHDRLWLGAYYEDEVGDKGWSFDELTLYPIVKQVSPPADFEPPRIETRPPPPSPEEQEELFQDIAKIYKPSDAVTAQAKLKMAAELFNLGLQTTENYAERFVLLRSAALLAQHAGDAALMLAAVDAMAQSFQIDGVEAKHAIMLELAKSADTKAALESLVENSSRVIDEAVAGGRVDLAESLAAEIYDNVATNPRGTSVRKQAFDQRKRVKEAYREWEIFQSALTDLKTNPVDGKANFIVGRWYCFKEGNWRKGLPFLAKSNTEAIQRLAERELTPIPDSVEDEVSLGDGWWDAASALPAEEKRHALRRAGYWYTRALPEVTSSIQKLKLEKRLDDIQAIEEK